ncbi:hypothetical protein PEC301875_13610 [Pectobacterium carotovorum subsp. carotovorum]|nr:hypothetical protein PEC301875_13610 [Pectobacterium carotovorum subsp. carotovorum]
MRVVCCLQGVWQGNPADFNIIRQNQILNDFSWLNCYVITYHLVRRELIATKV